MSYRLGVVRPGRPLTAVVAVAEARVVEHELTCRLGEITLDLRVDGDGIGPWSPADHAAWPADVDDVIDASTLWTSDLPPLTTLFARTVRPDAAEVRRRMLHHLRVLPVDRVDDAFVRAWCELGAVRPTDLWLVIRQARTVDVSDVALTGFLADPSLDGSGDSPIDAAFDRVVGTLATGPSADSLAERLRRALSEAAAAQARADESADEARRIEREAVERLDELDAEIRVLHEQIERTELRTELQSADGST